MIDETISHLVRATAGEGDDPAVTRMVRQGMRRFAASLPGGMSTVFEEILLSLARAAEELPADATPSEIRDRARLIRHRPN